MKKRSVCVLILLIVSIYSFGVAYAGENVIVIDDFPPGVGESAPREFFQPYLGQLQRYVYRVIRSDSLGVELSAGVDTLHYDARHDGSNGGLAVDRLMILKSILLEMGLPIEKIVKESFFITPDTGCQYRFAMVEIVPLPDRHGGRDTTIYKTTHVQHVENILISRYFGGMTLGVSTAPDANAIFTLGGRLRLTDRIVLEGQIGHSLLSNTQTVEHGKRLDAYGLHYGAYLTYRFERCVSNYDTLDCTAMMLNVIIGISQTENNTKDQFDYLLKRRVFEGGITYRYNWLEFRGLVGYGFDEVWDRKTVDYGFSARFQVVAIVFGQ